MISLVKLVLHNTNYMAINILSVIRQKGESQNGCFKKRKHAIFSEKRTSPVSGSNKYYFFGKFGALCFLETPVLRFALLPYYRRSNFPQSIINVFSLIKKVRWKLFIQIITCLKWLLSVTLFLTKQSGLPLDQDFKILLIFKISQDNRFVK